MPFDITPEEPDTRLRFKVPVHDRAHPILRAWHLAWSAKSPHRAFDAWWLCWHLAGRAGWHGSGPDGVKIPGGQWLLPPGSPFRMVGERAA